jgi:hypothetical protein
MEGGTHCSPREQGGNSSLRPRDNSQTMQCTAVDSKVWGRAPCGERRDDYLVGGRGSWESYTENWFDYNSQNIRDRLINFVGKKLSMCSIN